jgi:hypothetical protein
MMQDNVRLDRNGGCWLVKKQTFSVIIKRHEPGWHYIDMPFNALEVYGKASRIPVNAMIDGLTFRTTLLPGSDGHYIVINDTMREATGKGVGDSVTVELDVDDRPREVTVPVDIQQALHKDKKAMELYLALAYSHRKRYIEWVEGAKKAETRARRVERLINELKDMKK